MTISRAVPDVSLCTHLLEAGNLSRPFALQITSDAAVYACPACVTESIITELRLPDIEPSAVASSLHFDRCEHDGSHEGRPCWVCLEAASAALTQRWALLYWQDKTAANRLRRVIQQLNKQHDPARLDPDYEAFSRFLSTALERETPKRKRLSAAEKIQERNAAIALQRGFPESWALQRKQQDGAIKVAQIAPQ